MLRNIALPNYQYVDSAEKIWCNKLFTPFFLFALCINQKLNKAKGIC